MVVIDGKTLMANEKRPWTLDHQLLRKSLSHHFFEQHAEITKHKADNKAAIINSRNPDHDLRRVKDMEEISRKLASGLKSTGLKRTDSILLMVFNNVDFFCPIFASWFLGGQASVVSPVLSAANLAKQLSAIKIRHVFCAPYSVETVLEGIRIFNTSDELFKNEVVHIIVMDNIDPMSDSWKNLKADGGNLTISGYTDIIEKHQPIKDVDTAKDFNSDDSSVIFWSSGTTGEPKGAVFAFAYVLRLIIFEKSLFDVPTDKEQNYLASVNMFHNGGFCFTFVNGLKNGHNLIIFTPPKPEDVPVSTDELFLACHNYKPELLMIGSHHAILLGHKRPTRNDLDLSSVYYILPMGAPVHAELPVELRSNFPGFRNLLIMYGMTETMLISVSTTPLALGELGPGVEARIVDNEKSSDDNIVLLGPNEVGELQVRTQYMMKGYLDKELNNQFWTKDGFGRTGDLCYYSDHGVLHFSSRLKDLIKYQGNHLYPAELEAIIQKHAGVAEVVVFGLPDPTVQELVTALVVPNTGYELTSEEIIKCLVDAGIENFKYIRGGVKFVQQFPKNATGKILRRELPDFYKSLD